MDSERSSREPFPGIDKSSVARLMGEPYSAEDVSQYQKIIDREQRRQERRDKIGHVTDTIMEQVIGTTRGDWVARTAVVVLFADRFLHFL